MMRGKKSSCVGLYLDNCRGVIYLRKEEKGQ